MKSKATLSLLVFVLPPLVLPVFAIRAFATEDEMSVVGLDKDHRSFVQKVSEASYLDQMQKALNGVHRSIQPVLEKKAQALSASSSKPVWRLRTVAVGVNATFTAGLGFLGGVTLNPRFRLVYTNSINPVFPD